MKFDLKNLVFSLVIVRPREAFFEWLKPVLDRQGTTIEEVYFPEENGVWLIPSIGTFPDTASFEAYLKRLKTEISLKELGKFGPTRSEVSLPLTPSFCDLLFEFEVRDAAQRAPAV